MMIIWMLRMFLDKINVQVIKETSTTLNLYAILTTRSVLKFNRVNLQNNFQANDDLLSIGKQEARSFLSSV